MPPPPSASVLSLDVRLHHDELLAAWRADSRRLVIETRSAVPVRQRVAARITLVGRSAAATITGRVTSASRHEKTHRIELAPDEMRQRALERLLAIARGEAYEYRTRIPRLLATIPAVVLGPAGPIYMTTFSVSQDGCGLTWSGSEPATVGSKVDVRLGAGTRAVTFRSVVCWTARAGSTNTVGLRFIAGAKDGWSTLLAEAQLSGAPPA